jgi:Pyridoxamine 5'-phosphate oxidase
MDETAAELAELQALLTRSRAGATEHLRAIVRDDRTLTAAELPPRLTGMRTLSIATVTASGEPRISAIDGHFLHGRWVFGTDRTAAKAIHLAARPAVSVSYLEGEQLGVFTHGHARPLNPADGPVDPDWPAVLAHMTAHYGSSPLTWGDVVYYRLEPSWMVVFSSNE